jgi:hypothetical protein
MNGLAGLVGRVELHPGRALPTISSSRPELAARVAVGRRAIELPQILGALYTLCSAAHRQAARSAVAAALGTAEPPTQAELQTLRATQAREQILRITHDWPRQLGPAPHTEAASALLLRSCPLWRADLELPAQLDALPAWLEHKWLGLPPGRWLAAHDDDPRGWAERWCLTARGPVASTLRAQGAAARRLGTRAAALDLALDDPARHLPALARRMAEEPGYCAQPGWCGSVPDTGPWSRQRDRSRLAADSAWVRLLSRVVDVLRLAAPGGEDWLAHGALPLGSNEGIAWVEMARGLLVHWVRLEGPGPDARVGACRVLAPTEWNFHPQGVLAQALSALHAPGGSDGARCLAVAFDPCVEFIIHPFESAGACHA